MNKILLTYVSFVIACLTVIGAFMTAVTYTQLAVAILLYPVLVFFAIKAFPRRSLKTSPSVLSQIQEEPEPEEEDATETKKINNIGISDIDKRVFLKLIGGAGIFLFLFSILSKKTEGLFFKNLPGSVQGKISLQDTSGKTIDPAQNQPTDGYSICEIDDSVIAYYGYTNKDGAWFVMKIDTNSGSIRYSRDNSKFPDNWNNRVNLKYDYYNNVF